jgi:hypothetical protein
MPITRRCLQRCTGDRQHACTRTQHAGYILQHAKITRVPSYRHKRQQPFCGSWRLAIHYCTHSRLPNPPDAAGQSHAWLCKARTCSSSVQQPSTAHAPCTTYFCYSILRNSTVLLTIILPPCYLWLLLTCLADLLSGPPMRTKRSAVSGGPAKAPQAHVHMLM